MATKLNAKKPLTPKPSALPTAGLLWQLPSYHKAGCFPLTARKVDALDDGMKVYLGEGFVADLFLEMATA